MRSKDERNKTKQDIPLQRHLALITDLQSADFGLGARHAETPERVLPVRRTANRAAVESPGSARTLRRPWGLRLRVGTGFAAHGGAADGAHLYGAGAHARRICGWVPQVYTRTRDTDGRRFRGNGFVFLFFV